ncbi:methyl-accepting chemotaxis protein [uncultured Methylobacterium sp.]|uniref:methyl-accepting chemotaxis protein n=1 Tax=uncultured Methylobacterium sp. TaxID=157278 RepID=UPI0035CA26E8
MSLSIGKRILLGFSAVTVVIVALGLYAIGQIGAVRDATDKIVTRDLVVLSQLDVLGNQVRDLGILRRNAVIATLMRAQGRTVRDEDILTPWRRIATAIDTLFADLLRETGEYRTRAISADRMAAWDRLFSILNQAAETYRPYRDGSEAQLTAAVAGDIPAVEGRNDDVGRLYEATVAGVERARLALDDSIGTGQRGVADLYERSRLSILLTLAASLLLTVLVTALISRAVVRPIEAVMQFAERVGAGDLSGTLPARGGDEVARLARTLNGMVAGLSDLARTNRAATADLNAAAAEIRASAQQQAASVEEQFAAVQETAATVDQITHSGAQISKRAGEVIATAQATAQTSRQGLRAVADTAKAMDAIREQAEAVAGNIVTLSEKTQTIGDIIETVNDISERTHLLALNAAIEAAAAGESGRSFAVVASEMKLLADQAKGATTQVRAILSEIQRGINTSVMLTEEAVKRAVAGKSRSDTTQRTIEEITARVEENVQTFQQIVASTNQQQLGIEQVMGALQNIRQASQQTAAGTREVEAASANLTELAQALMALAERYRH